MVVSVFSVVFAIGLLRRFYISTVILDPLAFVPNTLSCSQYGLLQNPGLHTCFGLNLNSGLNKTNVFASKPSFTQLFYTKTVLSTNTMFYTKTMFLLGLC